jgi:glycerol uptake facilitator-like aquaporin
VTKALAAAAAAEFTGTALLLAVIVGSGIMGERLADGNMAVALFANSFATGCGLFVLIVIFAPVSGSHFNPLVSILARFEGTLGNRALAVYIAMQLVGAVAGVALAHGTFDLEAWAPSVKERTGLGQSLAEGVATFGLVLAILGARRHGTVTVAAVVAAYIACAYWFTASTSFANPAVTVARSLTPTFTGIAPQGVAAFVLAQTIGAALGAILGVWLFERAHRAKQDSPGAD